MRYEDIEQLLLDNTVFVSKQDVISGIRSLILEWKQARQPYRALYVYCPSDKIGSEQWIYLSVKDLLPSHKLLKDKNDIHAGCEILYMDDWSLSGCHAMGSFEEMMYKNTTPGVLHTFIFYIMSKNAVKSVNRLVQDTYPHVKYHILYSRMIAGFDEILINHGIDPGCASVVAFHKKVNPDTEEWSYPIVSDYKIPNQFGSYPTIYGDLYPIDRQFMEDIEHEWDILQ